VKGSGRALFKVLSEHFPGGTEGNHENLREDSRSPVRDLISGLPESEAGVVTTQRNIGKNT
jgi:hypothetical protein